MKHLFKSFNLVFISIHLFAMEEAPRSQLTPGVYLAEVDNQSDEHIRISICDIEPEYQYQEQQLIGFRCRTDYDKNPFMKFLKLVHPGQKVTEIIPIPMSHPVLNRNREMTSAAALRIDRIEHPEKKPEQFWLHRTNEYNALVFYIKSRDRLGGFMGAMPHYESSKSSKPDSLFTLIKLVIEKPHLLGMKISAQTVSQIPEPPKEEEPKNQPRRIRVIRKQRP